MLLQLVCLLLVYKLVVQTCGRPFSSQELCVSIYYLPYCTQNPENHPICGSMHLLPSTISIHPPSVVVGYDSRMGGPSPSDTAHLIHLQREVDKVWPLFVAVYIYHRNFLFTCLLLGTVPTASVSDIFSRSEMILLYKLTVRIIVLRSKISAIWA